MLVTITISLGLQNIPDTTGTKRQKGLGMTSILVITSDDHFEDFRRLPYAHQLTLCSLCAAEFVSVCRTKSLHSTRSFSLTIELSKPSQSVHVIVNPVSSAFV